MGQYMYFYVKVDEKLHFVDEIKDNGLHNFTRDFEAPYGDARSYTSDEILYQIKEYEEIIKRAEKDIERDEEMISLATKMEDTPLKERLETAWKYKDDITEWKDFIKEKKDDIEYLYKYIFLNKIFGDGAVWIGIESGRNFDPENPPIKKWNESHKL